MALRIDPSEKITSVRECWKAKVRMVRLWYLPSFNNPETINSIEMVFMDEFMLGLLTVVGTKKEYDKEGKKTKMIVIELDIDSVKLEVAFFGNYVDEVNTFIANGGIHQLVIVVQFMRMNTFKGKIVLQNVMCGTRLLFNPNIFEVFEFKNRLLAAIEENSQSFVIISDAPYNSLEDDFLKGTPRMFIQELKDYKDDDLYIVFGNVKCVNNDPNWWYAACKCNKAVIPDSVMYYCERCFCHVVNVVPRIAMAMSF